MLRFKMKISDNAKKSTIHILYELFYRQKFYFFISILFFFGNWVIEPYAISKIFGNVIGVINSHPKDGIIAKLQFKFILYICLFIMQYIFYAIGIYFYSKYITNLEMQCRMLIFKHIQNIKYKHFLSEGEGSFSKAIDIFSSSLVFVNTILMKKIIPALLALTFLIIEFFYAHLYVGIIIVLWLIIHFSISLYYIREMRNITEKQTQIHQKIYTFCVDVFKNQKTNYFFNLMEYNSNKLQNLQIIDKNIHIDVILLMSKIRFLKGFFCTILQGVFVNLFLFYLWHNGLITLGNFSTLIYMNGAIIHLVWHISEHFPDLLYAIQRVSTVLKYFDPNLSNQTLLPKLNIIDPKGQITIDNLSFAYDDHKIINNLSLVIKPKSKTLIMGYSGIGKSTLLNIICGLIADYEGNIFIDKVNIKNLRKTCISNYFGFIFNDGIISGTIQENIALDQQIRKGDIEKLLKKLGLPYKAEEEIFSSNNRLSQGEEQRILIARGIYNKNSQVLICDEPFRGLDFQNKKNVQNMLFKLIEDKTFIAVDHDLTLLEYVDNVIFFSDNNEILILPPEQIKKTPSFKRFINDINK